MSLSGMLAANAVLGVLFGIGFLVIPDQVMAAWGVDGDVMSRYFARLTGAVYLSIGLLSWQARSRPWRDVLVLPMALTHVLSTLTALNQVFVGSGSVPMRWVSVALFGYLAVGFVLNAFGKRVEAPLPN